MTTRKVPTPDPHDRYRVVLDYVGGRKPWRARAMEWRTNIYDMDLGWRIMPLPDIIGTAYFLDKRPERAWRKARAVVSLALRENDEADMFAAISFGGYDETFT